MTQNGRLLKEAMERLSNSKNAPVPSNTTGMMFMQNGGGLLSKTVTCSGCGHSWKSVEGGADPLTCHNCGGMITMGNGGYVVTRSNDRKGKTHKVTGPDGTVKYFGDSKLGQHPKDPERKAAFYARHKKNLEGNPYFRAFARKTWAEGGQTDNEREMVNGIADILSQVNDQQNRAQIARQMVQDFNNEDVTYNYDKFMKMSNLANGGMIKRADGSYSKRGLWDNIRANKGSGKKPTAEMLKQERKIRAEEAKYGMSVYGQGGTNNPGFEALPDYVQAQILSNMAYGGTSVVDYLESEGMKSDKASRARLAKEMNIQNYDYSGDKNLELLEKLKQTKQKKTLPGATNKKPEVRNVVTASNNPVFNTNRMMYSGYNNAGVKTVSDEKNLESGMVVDKRTNTGYIVKGGKAVKSFPVLTGKNSEGTSKPWNTEETEGRDERKITPAGTYTMDINKHYPNIYGAPGFYINPVAAFNEPAAIAKDLAVHQTYDPANRNMFYSMSPEQRYQSYGCINCRNPDMAELVREFPNSDTLMVIDPLKNKRDMEFLKKVTRKEMGGVYDEGGLVEDPPFGSKPRAVAESTGVNKAVPMTAAQMKQAQLQKQADNKRIQEQKNAQREAERIAEFKKRAEVVNRRDFLTSNPSFKDRFKAQTFADITAAGMEDMRFRPDLTTSDRGMDGVIAFADEYLNPARWLAGTATAIASLPYNISHGNKLASAIGLAEALPLGSATGQGVKQVERMLPAFKQFMHSPAGHGAVHFGEEAVESAGRHKVYHDDMHASHHQYGGGVYDNMYADGGMTGDCPAGYQFDTASGQCVPAVKEMLGMAPAGSSKNASPKPLSFNAGFNRPDMYKLGLGYTGDLGQSGIKNSRYNMNFDLPNLFREGQGVGITGNYSKNNYNVAANAAFPAFGGRMTLTGGYDRNTAGNPNEEMASSAANMMRSAQPGNTRRSNVNAGAKWEGKVGKTNVVISGSYGNGRPGFKQGGSTFSGNAWYGTGGTFDQTEDDQSYPDVSQLPSRLGSFDQNAANKKTFGTFDPKAPAFSLGYTAQGLPDSREQDIVSPSAYDITGVNRFYGKQLGTPAPKPKNPFNPAKVADSLMDQTYGNPWSLYNMASFAGNVVDGINNRRDMRNAERKERDNYSTMGLYAVQDPRQGTRGFRPVSGTQQNMDMPDQIGGIFSMQGMNQKYFNPFRAAEGMQIDSAYAPGETLSEFVPSYAPTSESVVSKDIRENYTPSTKNSTPSLPEADTNLKEFIAQKESGGDYKALPKDPKTGKLVSSAAGKYQFIWSLHGKAIQNITGVKTKDEFLNNPEAQEAYMDYWDATTLTPTANELIAKGVKAPLPAIKYMVHFSGAQGAKDYFLKGKETVDGFGMSTSKQMQRMGVSEQGGEVEMSADEIMNFMAMGGEIEYLD